jgi:hypothetical protein
VTRPKRIIAFIPRVLAPRPITFDTPTVIIGSRPDADLVLDDASEPVHALVRLRGESVEMAAFGPVELNGTLVERATLAEGDHLRIGRFSFVFVTMEQQEEETRPQPPVELPNLEGMLSGVDRDPAGIPNAVIASGDAPLAAAELRTEVALFWGNELLQVAHFAEGATVRVGEGAGNDFVLAAKEIKDKSFVLVGPGNIVHVPSTAAVEVGTSTQRLDRAALVESARLTSERLHLEKNEKVAIGLGALTLVIKRVPSAHAVARPMSARIDEAFVGTLAFTGVVAAFLIGLTLLTPQAQDDPRELLSAQRRTPPSITFQKPKPQPSAGSQAPNTIGTLGRPSSTKQHTAPAKRAQDVGLLAILKGSKSTVATNVLGAGGLGEALNKLASGLAGRDQGEQHGTGGLGTRGTDAGGGGTTQGIGPLGNGGKDGLGDVDLGPGTRAERAIQVDQSGKTNDGLSREHIARVLERAQSQFRHCYDQALGRAPNLHGKVSLEFTIGQDGSVSGTRAVSTLQDREVEGCLERVVRRLRFAEPKGGGTVSVKYPLVFTTSGH